LKLEISFLNKWSYLFSQAELAKSFLTNCLKFLQECIEGIYIVITYYKQHFPFCWLLLNKIDQQYTELQGKCCNRRQTQNICKIEGKETLYLQNHFTISKNYKKKKEKKETLPTYLHPLCFHMIQNTHKESINVVFC